MSLGGYGFSNKLSPEELEAWLADRSGLEWIVSEQDGKLVAETDDGHSLPPAHKDKARSEWTEPLVNLIRKIDPQRLACC